MKGYVSLHREIMEHWIWEDPVKLKRWLTILMNVNHAPKKFPVGNELFTCNPGQSFRSIQQWTDLFSCSKSTTIKFLNMLENDGMILTEIMGNGNRRKHLLTVVNWEKFQKMSTGNYTETVPEIIPEQYPNVPPNNNDNNDEESLYAKARNFYQNELEKSNNDFLYSQFIDILFGKSERYPGGRYDNLLKIEKQVTIDDFKKLKLEADKNDLHISKVLNRIENDKKYYQGKNSLSRLISAWLNNPITTKA